LKGRRNWEDIKMEDIIRKIKKVKKENIKGKYKRKK